MFVIVYISDALSSLFQINFGSPRVGNGPFMKAFNKAAKGSFRALRIVNGIDLVPRVPPGVWPFDYRHAGDLIHLKVETLTVVSTIILCREVGHLTYCIEFGCLALWTMTIPNSVVLVNSVTTRGCKSYCKHENMVISG